MKVILHDLDTNYEKMLKLKCNHLLQADGKYAACQGCFSCWTKHPAECFMHDKLKDVCRIIGRADELIVITKNCYGTYSPFVKTIMDRSIGLSTPLSTYRGGQMHHTLRYGKHEMMKVYVYGDMLEHEKNTFALIVQRNAINYGYRQSQVVFIEHPDQLAGIIE